MSEFTTNELNAIVHAIDRIPAIITSSGGGISNRVPYTGATANVNLGAFGLTANSLASTTLTVASTSSFSGNLGITDVNIVLGTTKGTKIGTATTQKLGFWNATPVVQQTTAIGSGTFATGTSGLLDGSAQYGGYTVGQVVAALKLYGFLQ